MGREGYRALPFAAGPEQRDLAERLPRPERRQGHGALCDALSTPCPSSSSCPYSQTS
jgi:hypothetical protein